MDKFVNVGNHPHSSLKHLNEHDYDVTETSKYVLAYMSGFVVRKTYRFSNCQECDDSLKSKKRRDHDKLIEISTHGSLIFPSQR